MDRRRFLVLSTASVLSVVAGCLEDDVDIRVFAVNLEPSTATVGETVEVIVHIGNWGEHEGSVSVALYLDEEHWDETTETVTGSPDDDLPGARITFAVDTTGVEPGTYELKTTVDGEEQAESRLGYEVTPTLTVAE